MSKENKGREFYVREGKAHDLDIALKPFWPPLKGSKYFMVIETTAFEKCQSEKQALEQRLAEVFDLLDKCEQSIRTSIKYDLDNGIMDLDFTEPEAQRYSDFVKLSEELFAFKTSPADRSKDG